MPMRTSPYNTHEHISCDSRKRIYNSSTRHAAHCLNLWTSVKHDCRTLITAPFCFPYRREDSVTYVRLHVLQYQPLKLWRTSDRKEKWTTRRSVASARSRMASVDYQSESSVYMRDAIYNCQWPGHVTQYPPLAHR
jgi:hypothetical protein